MANFKHTNNNNNNWKNSMCGSSQISRKIPSFNGRELSAHQLEERFCATVGGVSWQDVVQNQKYMYQHEKILEWNDSAVEEAFRDAKNRFWANIRGQPCDTKLPDPNIFIDEINWDSTVDPELLSDLENRELDSSSETEKSDGGVIIGIPSIIIQSDFTPTGWGDAEYVKPQQQCCERQDDVRNDGWGDESWKRDQKNFANNSWEDDYVYVTQNMVRDGENRVNGPNWNGYKKQRDYASNRKSDHGGWGTSRYKISRFQHNNYAQPSLNNYGGRKASFSCERPLLTWKPVTRRW